MYLIFQKDWSEQVVPTQFQVQFQRKPVNTLEWMREAELKHGRLSMLAVVGWIAVDSGLRLPFSNFQFIENSFVAHNEGVQNGSMGLLLFAVFILELVSGVAIFDQSKVNMHKSIFTGPIRMYIYRCMYIYGHKYTHMYIYIFI
jgi:hypothetical protein